MKILRVERDIFGNGIGKIDIDGVQYDVFHDVFRHWAGKHRASGLSREEVEILDHALDIELAKYDAEKHCHICDKCIPQHILKREPNAMFCSAGCKEEWWEIYETGE